MKKIKLISEVFVLLFFCAVIQVYGQRNVNPDPNGDPWWTGDGLEPLEELTTAAEIQLSSQSYATLLPNFVYNDALPYFPNIYNQDGASCVHAAEVNYTYTYEVNRKRNLTAGDYFPETANKENLYNGMYSYNFYNGGSGENGTPFGSGFNVIKRNGCPTFLNFEDPALHGSNKYKYWMTGYDKYKDGMYNTLLTTHNISFSNNLTGQIEWLNKMKHWINDHGNGESTGGLAVIGVFTSNVYGQLSWNTNTTIPSNSPYHANERYISLLGTHGGHALTIVGYNDDVFVQDINGDGQYTTDQDVNGDGIIDIKDYEKGVFKVANSWGQYWNSQSGGFILMPYKLFYLSNNGFVIKYAYNCDVFSEQPEIPTPNITLKANIDHNGRDRISLKVASGENASSVPPIDGLFKHFSCFNMQGGAFTMRGAYTGPIDIGLNYGHFYQDFGKVFFRVIEENGGAYNGNINSLSLVDYRWGETFELPCPQVPTSILNNTNTTLSIEYHLLPHHDEAIKENTTLTTNRVSRFTTNVTENSVLALAQGVKIDMYSSEIHIDAGSALLMAKDSKITAKRGSCKVIIEGNFSTSGSNITFAADNGAYLDVYFSNLSTSNTIANVNFNNCSVFGINEALTFTNCTFTNCKEIKSSWGNTTFTSSTFTNTGLYLDNSSRNPDYSANVTGCTFTNNLSDMVGINISRYGCYFISGNTISNYYDGIEINNSGLGKSGNQKIEYNTIHSCSGNGIIAYSSIGSIYTNNIYNNYYGVRFMNNCSFALHGDPNATTISQTQQISNNTNTEVYSSEFSFPYYFRYNSIVDADNLGKPSDPLLWFDRPVYANTTKADVAFCHWGAGFNQAQDLMGNNVIFLTYPQWTPGTIAPVGPDEDLYTTASNYFADGDYALAKAQYQLLINLYPKSQYAEAAIKDLVRLEEYAGKDYAGLQEYFLTNDSITNDTILSEVAEIAANDCDIKQQNYPLAIDWYENRILNADNTADSIFAVIDLGYVYTLMEEDGLRSNFIGRYPEYKPVNKIAYYKTKNYLLSLLPLNSSSRQNSDMANASLIQNYPNPSTESTLISFSLNVGANVSITINDNLGKTVKSIELGKLDKGAQVYTLSTNNLPTGLYYYSLYVDGKLQQTQKMSVIK
ncbi:MAG TPA: right-handed parallel beta-helix repeat-containing protein [Lentimicrobium sp.]|nr:right-handed parallel beta-helix repeat-containing protein [Lentimicrobium sp.]